MKYVIFYSWQSDLPNNTNRGFIESVIQQAIKDIRKTEDYELEPSVDRDTQGVPGAPDIAQAILDKIKACDAFVADISIVTGGKDSGTRPSPNPNVLLELGYAIALLGWDRIILFFNEVNGTAEDLPFDLRPHRRIPYTLLRDDVKSGIRKELATHFKGRLAELLEKGKTNSLLKRPLLSVSWNRRKVEEDKGSDDGVNSNSIVFTRVADASSVKRKVADEILTAQNIKGGIDQNWDQKLDRYVTEAKQFLRDLTNDAKCNKYLMNSNADKAYAVTLSLGNDGNAAASDIRVEVSLPEWLLALKEFPDNKKAPQKPQMPVPTLLSMRDFASTMSGYADIFHRIGTPVIENINRTSACYMRNGDIFLWADRLLHKHTLTHIKDRFYLMALPNAPKGNHVFKGHVFCSEYDDWQQIELEINVV